ncbi:MAG: DNA-3-methyladenine glycosylase [bacterium]|nr:DNA-3-methyladenine glycosylase [bacterium]
MKKIIRQQFFNRSALKVGPDLLGKYLVRLLNREEHSYKITEVEAYEGLDDQASHAFKGRTPRTELMFGEAGVFYIYVIYGIYYMCNIVTGKKDFPSAVLIRGVEKINGPGKLTRKLRIKKDLNGLKVEKKTGLWIEDRGVIINPKLIRKSTRIGVDYAGPVWSKKEYRFYLE